MYLILNFFNFYNSSLDISAIFAPTFKYYSFKYYFLMYLLSNRKIRKFPFDWKYPKNRSYRFRNKNGRQSLPAYSLETRSSEERSSCCDGCLVLSKEVRSLRVCTPAGYSAKFPVTISQTLQQTSGKQIRQILSQLHRILNRHKLLRYQFYELKKIFKSDRTELLHLK